MAAYGVAPLTDSGVLVNLVFDVVGTAGSETDLAFGDFMFNEGIPASTTHHGHFAARSLSISGTATYIPNSAPVHEVTMTLSGIADDAVLTALDGSYTFNPDGIGNYTVTPSKEGDVRDAISALDAAWIAQYTVGARTFDAYQLDVGDVTQDGQVSAYDAALVARFAVDLFDPPSLVGEWRFEPGLREYLPLDRDLAGEDYQARLYGDVTGNWGSQSRGAMEENVIVTLPSLEAQVGELIEVPIQTSDLSGLDVLAYEYVLEFDPAVIELRTISQTNTLSADWSVVANHDQPGQVQIAAYGVEPLSGEGPLLSLSFTATGEEGESSSLEFGEFEFNEGTPSAQTVAGQVQISLHQVFLPWVVRGGH